MRKLLCKIFGHKYKFFNVPLGKNHTASFAACIRCDNRLPTILSDSNLKENKYYLIDKNGEKINFTERGLKCD